MENKKSSKKAFGKSFGKNPAPRPGDKKFAPGSRGPHGSRPAAPGRDQMRKPREKPVKRLTVDKELDCPIAALCQSCKYINTDYKKSLATKYDAAIEAMRQAGVLGHARLIAPEPSPRTFGYRTHAKLAVRPVAKCANPEKKSRFAIGLFAPGSHDVISVPECPLQKELMNKLISSLQFELDISQLTPYDEEALTGDVRYLAIRATGSKDNMMLTFVMTSDEHLEVIQEIVETLVEDGHPIASAHININSENTNTIFGPETITIFGDDTLPVQICGLNFELGPTSFFQVNPWIAEIIYRRVEQHAGRASNERQIAWDLYCGIGQLSLLLANAGYRVFGLEANPQAIKDAERTARLNDISNMPHFVAARAEELGSVLPEWAQTPQLIITNPTRKGLNEEVASHLRDVLKSHPESRLIYVSCEAETLAKDLKILQESGKQLRQLEAFDMFPYTEKLEWLAVIS
jgi:23S rRNA (uracil1939-C5)-methyltransferase